jgi:hypothetical protein
MDGWAEYENFLNIIFIIMKFMCHVAFYCWIIAYCAISSWLSISLNDFYTRFSYCLWISLSRILNFFSACSKCARDKDMCFRWRSIYFLLLDSFFILYVWTFLCKLFDFSPLYYDKLRPFSLADRINIKLPKELEAFFVYLMCYIMCTFIYERTSS